MLCPRYCIASTLVMGFGFKNLRGDFVSPASILREYVCCYAMLSAHSYWLPVSLNFVSELWLTALRLDHHLDAFQLKNKRQEGDMVAAQDQELREILDSAHNEYDIHLSSDERTDVRS